MWRQRIALLSGIVLTVLALVNGANQRERVSQDLCIYGCYKNIHCRAKGIPEVRINSEGQLSV